MRSAKYNVMCFFIVDSAKTSQQTQQVEAPAQTTILDTPLLDTTQVINFIITAQKPIMFPLPGHTSPE